LTFSPDGKRLASVGRGAEAATVLIWDVADATHRPPARKNAGANEVAAWCAALVDGDAEAAHRAAWALTAAPEQAVRRLKELAAMQKLPRPEEVQRWIAELDHTRFAVREKAMRELSRLDDVAGAVEAALKDPVSLEKRRRLERVLTVMRNRPASVAQLFALRGVLVLERIGTAAARDLLRQFAAGDVDPRLTQEARGALRRLAGRPLTP
jgi:hypothetical protein